MGSADAALISFMIGLLWAWQRRQSLAPIARGARFVMGSADAAVGFV